jgi:Domain of unknown function (DUF4331)
MARIGVPGRVPRTVLLAALLTMAFAAFMALVLLNGPAPTPAGASSHAEAPLISQDPRADNTDLYAFVSPDKPDTVTIVANYIPLEAPASGPNFYSFDPSVLYQIHVVSGVTGPGQGDETTYSFRFNTATRNPNTFLYATGPISSNGDPNWNRPQTYSITKTTDHSQQVLGTGIPTPPDAVGPRSTPNYNSLANAAVTNVGGIKVFAGQRDDPFFVDLGSIFDLGGLRPFNNLHILPLDTDTGHDAVAGYNVHTIEMQIPTDQLTEPGHPTIGVYASASRQQVRILPGNGTVENHANWVQVSRLGQPLINEVVIPLGKKDYWNASDPQDDNQFLKYYLNPEITRLENALYPALDNADETGRTDLQAILLTGIPGVNKTGTNNEDLLRLNTSIPPDAPVGQGDRLGALDGQLSGYPNGRRLEDHVIDIDLRAFAQGYGSFLHAALSLPDRSPNDLLGDGVDSNDKPFSTTFPYLAPPNQGYDLP